MPAPLPPRPGPESPLWVIAWAVCLVRQNYISCGPAIMALSRQLRCLVPNTPLLRYRSPAYWRLFLALTSSPMVAEKSADQSQLGL